MSYPPRTRSSLPPRALRTSKRRRWICFMTRMLWNMPWSSRSNENSEIHTYVGQPQALVTYQRPPQKFRFGHSDAPSVPLEVFHTADYSRFQPLIDPPCRKYRCNDDNELDVADTSSIANQNNISAFPSNARDIIARSLNRGAHSVKAELASMIYHVDCGDIGTDTEG